MYVVRFNRCGVLIKINKTRRRQPPECAAERGEAAALASEVGSSGSAALSLFRCDDRSALHCVPWYVAILLNVGRFQDTLIIIIIVFIRGH